MRDVGKGSSAVHSLTQKRSVGRGILEVLVQDADYEWLMIDANYIEVHPHAAGARGGNQEIPRTKGA